MAQRLWNYSFQQCIYPPSNHSFTLTSSIKSCFFIHISINAWNCFSQSWLSETEWEGVSVTASVWFPQQTYKPIARRGNNAMWACRSAVISGGILSDSSPSRWPCFLSLAFSQWERGEGGTWQNLVAFHYYAESSLPHFWSSSSGGGKKQPSVTASVKFSIYPVTLLILNVKPKQRRAEENLRPRRTTGERQSVEPSRRKGDQWSLRECLSVSHSVTVCVCEQHCGRVACRERRALCVTDLSQNVKAASYPMRIFLQHEHGYWRVLLVWCSYSY